MTTYNTGNPIGSTDARDLYDNAQNLDNFSNGSAASYTDRLGVIRRSLAGIEATADGVLNGIGYQVPVTYASGISLTLTSQTVDYNGVIYAPKSSALPFTTSSWGTDSSKFRAIQVTDADLITYNPAGTEAVPTNVQSKLRETVSVEDLYASGTTNHTAAFIAACATGKRVIASASNYTIVGEIPMVSGTRLEFTSNPTITMDVSGENGRGFYFGAGVENACITGSANINVSASTLGSDGSRNGVFVFGSDFYVVADPAATRRCSVVGTFKITCTGANNTKPVAVLGYSEDILISGVYATGQTNYAFFCHWIGNGTSSTAPTKTWHPHRVKFENCVAEDTASGTLSRAFTVSAPGHVIMENCHAINATTLGFNVFVGDYGYSFAQNIINLDAFDVGLRDCSHKGGGTASALSVDGISSRLYSSPYWVGADRNASLNIDNFSAFMTTGANAIGVAVAGVAKFYARGLSIVEEGTGNTEQAMYITSCRDVDVQGDVFAKGGVLIRDCRTVEYNINTRRNEKTWDAVSYCVGSSATSISTTTGAAATAGDTSITIASSSIVTGPGGIIRYNNGSRDYEFEILTTTYSGSTQVLNCQPVPVNIPNGATITLIQTVKNLNIGDVTLEGARSLVRASGSATAKVRNLSCTGTRFCLSGIADVEASAVDGLFITGTNHNFGGNASSGTKYGILLNANTENFRIIGVHFGKENHKVNRLIDLVTATRGVVDCCVFESHLTGGEAIRDSGPPTSYVIGAGNIYGPGVTP